MKVPNFFGGSDVQRSTNLSDNELVNLYPTTNDDGSVRAFYKTDGLKVELTTSAVSTGAYTASNGRAFHVSGTTLFEITSTSGVLAETSRGTVTAGTYDFSDNGIEMICVNGTDGWLFTFSGNVLLKITVLSGNFTVNVATGADIDALLTTPTAHGLIAGDRVILSTTGSLPANLLSSTAYFVLAEGLTTTTFKVGYTLTGATCTISNGLSATVTKTSHGYFSGSKIRFLTTGVLPAPLAVGTIYYVLNDAITQDTFRISLTLGGAIIDTTTAGSGVHSFNHIITVIQTGLFHVPQGGRPLPVPEVVLFLPQTLLWLDRWHMVLYRGTVLLLK